MARKSRHVPDGISYPDPSWLKPYPEVLATASIHGWDVDLTYKRNIWTLEVYEGKELVIRCHSHHHPPDAFRRLGAQAKAALERSGRLS